MQKKRIVFIDEYGTPALSTEKTGVTNHYIIAAVQFKPSDIDLAIHHLDQIALQHFSGNEIKSNSVGKKDARRIRILKEMVRLPFFIHCLAIDKSKITKTGGLIFKTPFIKYMHGKLFSKLFLAFPDLDLVLDEHGSPEFMKGFEKYIAREYYQNDLFSTYTIRFQNSTASRLVQLADFVAGSFARVFDPKKLSEKREKILNILKPHVLSVEHWPLRIRGAYEREVISDSVDARIRLLSRRSVLKYLEDHYETTNQNEILQNEFLHYLVFCNEQKTGTRYVSSHNILQMLEENTGLVISDQKLRAKVVAPLRDVGIPIVSGSLGYKIALTAKEVLAFVKIVDGRVIPQLKRVRILRDSVFSSTEGELDILSKQYELLAKASEVVSGQF